MFYSRFQVQIVFKNKDSNEELALKRSISKRFIFCKSAYENLDRFHLLRRLFIIYSFANMS